MHSFKAGSASAKHFFGKTRRLWSGLANDPFGDPRLFLYCIDGDDRVSFMNSACDQFAIENGAPDLTAREITGQSIWSYISGTDVQALYRALFNYVRTRQESCRFPFRCDSPQTCRLMHMQLRPLGDAGVELCCSVISVRSRPQGEKKHGNDDGSSRVLELCSICNRARIEHGDWLEPDAALAERYLMRHSLSPQLIHVLCTECKTELQ